MKYFLFSLKYSQVVATEHDVNLSFETAPTNTTSQTNTLKLAAKVNVMDVIADSNAIKNSLLRCAQVTIFFLLS